MAGLFAGLTQGNWSDDPDRNEQARMGALLGASRAIDTYGKTGGQLLSQALGGFAEGQMGMRSMQLKERDVAADIAYKNALTGRADKEHATQIQQLGLKIYEARNSVWGQAFDAHALNPAGAPNPGPQPTLEESMQEAARGFAAMSTSGAGQRMGQPARSTAQQAAGGVFAPSGASAPGQPPQNGAAPPSGPPGGMPGGMPTPLGTHQGPPATPQPLGTHDPSQPPQIQLLGGAPQQSKSIDPSGGWDAINAQVRANQPAADQDALTLLNRERAGSTSPQTTADLDTQIKGLGGTPGMPPGAMAAGGPPPMPQGAAPQQGQEAPQARLARLTQGVQRMLAQGRAPSKEQMAAIQFASGEVERGHMVGPDGAVMPQPGMLAARQAGARATAYGSEAPKLVSILNADDSETRVTHEAYVAAKNAGIPMRTKLSPQEISRQQSNPNLMQVPSGGPNRPPRMMTQEQIRQEAMGAPGMGGQPGAPGMSGGAGIAVGPTPNEARWSGRRDATYDTDKATFGKFYDEAQVQRNNASTIVQTIDAARRIMPTDTGKWEEFSLPYKQWIADTIGMNVVDAQNLYRSEGFQGLMKEALVASQENFKGAVSNVEFKTSELSMPNLGNSREGNEFLLDFRQAAAEKTLWYAEQVERASVEARAAEQNGQVFNWVERMNKIKALRDSPATNLFNTPAMARWQSKIVQGK